MGAHAVGRESGANRNFTTENLVKREGEFLVFLKAREGRASNRVLYLL